MMLAIGLVAAVASGCVSTERAVVYDRDEPEQRLASMVDGVVARVDEAAHVVVLDNGQMYRVTGDQAIIVRGQPVHLSSVQPGTRVTIASGSPVAYRNGQYVALPAASATVSAPGDVTASQTAPVITAPPAPVVTAPPAPVVTAPPAAVVTAPPAGVAAPAATGSVVRMHGRVVDVESNGNVKIRLPDGNAFELRPPAGAVYRKGDPVTIDMTFGAPAPSALPR